LQVILKIKIEIEENRLIIMTSWIQVSCRTSNRPVGKTSLVKLEKDKLFKEIHTVKTVLRRAKLIWDTIV